MRHALASLQEYVVRAPKSSRRVFLGRFPAGKPGLAGVGTGAGWELSRVESDAGGHALLHLVGGAGHTTLVGTPETSQTAPYYLFMMRQEGVIDAVPSGPWYTFRPELRPRGALSLEEAEARMKARSRATETAGSWLARAGGAAAATRALPVGGGDDGGAGAGGDSDSEAVRRGAGSEEDSEEEEAPRKRRGKGGKGGGAEAAAADGGVEAEGEEPEAAAAHDGGRRRGGGGGESPDHGEDWEHERAMTDDDEAVGVGDQIEEQEEALPPPAAAEADAAEDGLDEEGQKMRKLLLAQRKGEGVEEDDDDDDGDLFEDDEAFEDEDFMDPDTDTRLTKLLGMRQAADAAAGAAEAGAAPQRAKRPRSPEADAAPGAAAPPPAKAQRVMSEAAAAELAAMEASCGITLVQLTEALTPPVPVTVRAGVCVCVWQRMCKGLMLHVCAGLDEALQAQSQDRICQDRLQGAAEALRAGRKRQDVPEMIIDAFSRLESARSRHVLCCAVELATLSRILSSWSWTFSSRPTARLAGAPSKVDSERCRPTHIHCGLALHACFPQAQRLGRRAAPRAHRRRRWTAALPVPPPCRRCVHTRLRWSLRRRLASCPFSKPRSFRPSWRITQRRLCCQRQRARAAACVPAWRA